MAYQALAGAYDDVTAGYQAESWTANLETRVLQLDPAGRQLLDVGCGTGKSFLPMVKRGWTVVGCDVSPAMLEIAKQKVGSAVPLHIADVRELPRFGEFDLAWALNDTFNYLMSDEELEAALAGMRRNLADEGVLLFDLNTLSGMRQLFASDTVLRVNGRAMRWASDPSREIQPGAICSSRFEIIGDSSATHRHRQRHFPEADVLRALERVGLECVEVWGDYEGAQSQPLDENRHQKAIYIAQPT